MKSTLIVAALLTLFMAAGASGQPAYVPPGFSPRPPMSPEQRKALEEKEKQQPQQQQQAAPAPQPAKPGSGAPAGKPTAASLAEEQKNIPATLPSVSTGSLNLQNASLTEVINVLAQQLKINYILDPRVGKGGVTINTYGETKSLDTRNLLDLILRINGAAIVRIEDNLYRIVPLADVMRMPGLKPEVNQKDIPDDDGPMLNLIFLKYATVEELAKLLDPFVGEGGRTIAYPPANLLLIQDSRRNMKRLMDLISLFDSDTFTGQRVRLFDISNSRPSDLSKELESIFKAISLSEKNVAVKFLPIDRINTLVAVASNPGAFESVEKWIKKLDIPIQITAGSVDNYVYRVKYGRAEMLAGAIMSLYGGYGYGGMGMMGGFGGYGGYGGGMYGGGIGGGMYGGGMYGGGMYGGGMYGGGMYPGTMTSGFTPTYQPNAGVMGGPVGAVVAGNGQVPQQTVAVNPLGPGGAPAPGSAKSGTDQTGQYLSGTTASGMEGIPRVVPNPFDNTLLIQATPAQHAGIMKLLRELDVPPRQVLIEAKIFEVDLTGLFAYGVAAALQLRGSGDPIKLPTRELLASSGAAGLDMSMGALVGRSRELLGLVTAQESTGKSKVVSAPSVIATDSIPASITVGAEVPTLTGQAVTGFQQGGNSLFAQNVQNRNSGTTLNILARVNASGIVTMVINQEVSAPVPPSPSAAIQSPSFSKRNISTQLTVQDGDTVALGGIIDEKSTYASGGIPGLHRLPLIGGIFGSRNYSKERTELIVFLTPRVIYDTAQITEATDELRNRLRRASKYDRDY